MPLTEKVLDQKLTASEQSLAPSTDPMCTADRPPASAAHAVALDHPHAPSPQCLEINFSQRRVKSFNEKSLFQPSLFSCYAISGFFSYTVIDHEARSEMSWKKSLQFTYICVCVCVSVHYCVHVYKCAHTEKFMTLSRRYLER